jgi:hypothetical protein
VSESARPLPAFTTWPTFPFEGDIRIKRLDDPVQMEPARHGENVNDCRACAAPDEAYIWVSERWRVRSLDRPTGLPMVLILESRSHLDLGDLPNLLAAELGVMTVRLERAIRTLDGVARVHVNRWGDGSAHLHLWFLARPYGRLQLRGTFLSLWDEILPTMPESQWRENLALIAAWLAEFGGRPLAEPPRIDWKAPASLTPAQPEAGSGGAAGDGADAAAGGEPATPAADAGAPVQTDHENSLLRAIEADLVLTGTAEEPPKPAVVSVPVVPAPREASGGVPAADEPVTVPDEPAEAEEPEAAVEPAGPGRDGALAADGAGTGRRARK